jgi:L-seryl-tRNA(Ser) seleniumtransferase
MNPRDPVKAEPRRSLPAVDRLIRGLERVASDVPLWARREAAREVLDAERARLGGAGPGSSEAPSEAELCERAAARAADLARPHPQPVINATGIPLHTNLGRAPLAAGAVRAVEIAARSYGDLELDLASGERGSRGEAVEHKLRLLSGAAGALVVNNNAAAGAARARGLAQGRSAIVSRGELVEIGGSFRVPEIMASAGVRLVEVGTTNRTHLRDYESAIDADTALLLKVHRSNFALRGFVAGGHARRARRAGRGARSPARGGPRQRHARRSLVARPARRRCSRRAGSRAARRGLLLRRQAARRTPGRDHPHARAAAWPTGCGATRSPARCAMDKLSLAALDWTLAAHLDGRAEREIPVLRQLLAAPDELRRRAAALAREAEHLRGLPRQGAGRTRSQLRGRRLAARPRARQLGGARRGAERATGRRAAAHGSAARGRAGAR